MKNEMTIHEALVKLTEMVDNASDKPTELEERLLEILESLRDGGGDETGVGTSDKMISMTAATECYWGSSGRGSTAAARKIEAAAASFGVLKIEGNKRRKVGITRKGRDMLERFGR